MPLRLIHSLETISAEAWNALNGGIRNPFLRHEFLSGLERHGCVGDHWGWLPHHLAIYEGDQLIGAVPMYLKYNSYGELVFDWNWADAYQRAGLNYYPKLVAAVPYSPVSGPRLLVRNDVDSEAVTGQLIDGALELARKLEVSSLHWLFPHDADMQRLERHGLMRRTGTQFHWHNRDYAGFDEYLATFNAQKRKKLKRERRRVAEQGIRIEVLDGHQATAEQWQVFHHFYRSTFDKRGGYPTLSEAFFRHLGESLPESIVLVLASYQGSYVAGALSLRSDDTLYGRHWGCEEEFHSLHFELCYYQGLDYCIKHGLQHFEPGAQGEHKVGRGFEPVPTWSAHWLADLSFSNAISDYLHHEQQGVRNYMQELSRHLPFKKTEP
ncbi:MAG: GNAT family N-acetyltransferase [Gammaproteobacteria bacterium]|nr:GNAT family N-acetyltransferase [Gammaproteobacteria bacterium]MCW8839619.1 GNAT family N-acetyltransferase [Gammaproteobacteria bacterium]MCW8928535.1 GNAT family N-acetyltransferase [Gammaproteobacteria bacterium]MCW8957645.1 GNAT family N-acetyltransferase [Gammaproteobacteria bacterium]MCW8973585.1 GNAT family N-acetyltransferase [Gammaproteobacteria bacterium]